MKPVIAALLPLAVVASPALAVGLAPLAKEGLTVGPNKALYLTVINPYAQPREFSIVPDGEPEASIAILPATVTIKPGGQRRIMVVIRDLAPGETRIARVCAQLAQQEGMIHARVCSKLSARRLGPRGA